MQIRNCTGVITPKFKTQADDAKTACECAQTSEDSVSLNSGELVSRLVDELFFTASSFVPLIGAASNLAAGWMTASTDKINGRITEVTRPNIGIAGSAANIAGSLAGAYAYITGSQTARILSYSLLGLSGAATATVFGITYYKDSLEGKH